MKLTASVVLPCLFAAVCGAAVITHGDNDNDVQKASEYRQWGQFPWDRPGNPPPIFPPDDFAFYRTGVLKNQKEPSDDDSRPWRDAFKDYHGDNSDEYRAWDKFPWERPNNPPPFVPPSDTMGFSQIGRWWNQDYLAGKPERPARYFGEDDVGDNSEEYRTWGKFPWEHPHNPPPFVPPSDIWAFSQIGRWWNQDYLAGKSERPARYFGQDASAEEIKKSLSSSKDQKLSRVARSIWPVKPWQKPWNPPPFLPDHFPRQ